MKAKKSGQKISGLPRLTDWDAPARAWGLGFLVCVSAGLIVALYYVHVASGITAPGLEARFHGPESDTVSTHTWRSLLQTTHTHLFTLTFLQFMLGGFTLLSSLPTRVRAWLAGGTFVLIVADHGAMWVLHVAGGTWAWGLMLTGSAMTLALGVEVAICVKDLLKR